MKREIPERLTEYCDGEARMVNSNAFGYKTVLKKLSAYEDIAVNPADVAPVVRAYWYECKDGHHTCSWCREMACRDELHIEILGMYCPYYGAKMDEREGFVNGNI